MPDGREHLPDPGFDEGAAIEDAARSVPHNLEQSEEAEQRVIQRVVIIAGIVLGILLVIVVSALLMTGDDDGADVPKVVSVDPLG